MRRYSAQALNKIFMAVAPSAGLICPRLPTSQPRHPGRPAYVFLRYSEIFPGTVDIPNFPS
jgi:hypothetical protein